MHEYRPTMNVPAYPLKYINTQDISDMSETSSVET